MSAEREIRGPRVGEGINQIVPNQLQYASNRRKKCIGIPYIVESRVVALPLHCMTDCECVVLPVTYECL